MKANEGDFDAQDDDDDIAGDLFCWSCALPSHNNLCAYARASEIWSSP